MRHTKTVLLVLALALASVPAPVSAQSSLEAELLSLINGGRRDAGNASLARHGGLAAQARRHSQTMSAAGALGHEGAAGRVSGATPDPMEANGAPDDGFTLSQWCENVGYVENVEDADVPEFIFNTWKESGSHKACMDDDVGRGITVVGVGLYHDGDGRWWATFEAVNDSTRPGSAPPTVTTPRPAARTSAPSQPTAATTTPLPTRAQVSTPLVSPTPELTAAPTPEVAPLAAPASVPPQAAAPQTRSTAARIAVVWLVLALIGGLLAALIVVPARRRARRVPGG